MDKPNGGFHREIPQKKQPVRYLIDNALAHGLVALLVGGAVFWGWIMVSIFVLLTH